MNSTPHRRGRGGGGGGGGGICGGVGGKAGARLHNNYDEVDWITVTGAICPASRIYIERTRFWHVKSTDPPPPNGEESNTSALPEEKGTKGTQHIRTHTHTHTRTHARTHAHWGDTPSLNLFRRYREERVQAIRIKPQTQGNVFYNLLQALVSVNFLHQRCVLTSPAEQNQRCRWQPSGQLWHLTVLCASSTTKRQSRNWIQKFSKNKQIYFLIIFDQHYWSCVFTK